MEQVVLIIDDELFNRMSLSMVLQSAQIRSVTASGGLKAVDIFNNLINLRKPIFRVVLLDFSMPDMNGPQTATEIFRICDAAGLKRPTIFCVSAYQDKTFIKAALDAGMTEFFTKPITI